MAKIDKRMVDINEIKSHRWFDKVNWDTVTQRGMQPPPLPDIEGQGPAGLRNKNKDAKLQKSYDARGRPFCGILNLSKATTMK